jgi:hypothetical protein
MFVSSTILPDYQTPSPMLQDDALKIFQAREPSSLKEKQTKKKPNKHRWQVGREAHCFRLVILQQNYHCS